MLIKKVFLIYIVIFIAGWHTCLGQTIGFDFESNVYSGYLFIDTTSNHKNVWQIGKPSKTIFNNAHSPTHAIITDTLNPYPKSDSSSFIVKVLHGYAMTVSVNISLSFYYKVHSDTLVDFGKIEISCDSGKTWIDLVKQDTFLQKVIIRSPNFTFSGNTGNWRQFRVGIGGCNLPTKLLLFKSTFISDSIQTNKEGWLIDDINIGVLPDVGIKEDLFNAYTSIYPNPVSEKLNISCHNHLEDNPYEIFDFSGKLILQGLINSTSIDISQLNEGLYVLKYYVGDKISIHKFIIKR